jgi:hypothetical protein
LDATVFNPRQHGSCSRSEDDLVEERHLLEVQGALDFLPGNRSPCPGLLEALTE